MFVLKIWAQEKFGLTPPLLQSEIDKQEAAFYFLCKPDIPFEDDPLRENALDRDRLFDIYCQTFIDQNLPFQVLSGSLENRIQIASKTIQFFLAKA